MFRTKRTKIFSLFRNYFVCSRVLGYICLVNLFLMAEERHLITLQEIILLNEERMRYVKLANLYVDNYEAAKDIFQDCILYVYSQKDSIYLSDVRNYFAVAVMNKARDYLRKRSVAGADKYEMSIENLKSLASLADMGGNSVLDIDLPGLISACKKRLSPLSYSVFEARRFGQMSHRQIAAMFGISERSVKYELSKAQRVFREVFMDYGVFTLAAVLYLMSVSTAVPASSGSDSSSCCHTAQVAE